MAAVEPILLSVVPIFTFNGQQKMTNATGFFFQRADRLYLVTSRHVVIDEVNHHRPNRIEIELHTDAQNLAKSVAFSMPLYQNQKPTWIQGSDSSSLVDVVVLEVNRSALPETAIYEAFEEHHLLLPKEPVGVGTPLLVVGFPLGFHDSLHHIPVVRQAIVASSFGLRFQGMGYFLADGRTHRGISGAPVVMRVSESQKQYGSLTWRLLGVHSSTFDVGSRDLAQDEALGLNGVWYADVLLTLTAVGSNSETPAEC